MNTKKEAKEKLVKRLTWWQISYRDDKRVTKEVHHKRKVGGIYNLEETGLLDEFYNFIEKIGVIKLIKRITL